MNYHVAEEDDIWGVYRDSELIGRAVSKRDAEAFIDAIRGPGDLRDRILSEVADAVENCFEVSKMARLYRPHIPIPVKIAAISRQLMRGNVVVSFASAPEKPLADRLAWMLDRFAETIGCKIKDLRLDHDPPLGARPRHRRGLNPKTFYTPDANDPDHLFYRPHGPEHEGSHLIKTNVRGDHGQHPDRVLIKKQRRIERGPKPKRGPKIKSPGFASVSGAKARWPKRKFGQ